MANEFSVAEFVQSMSNMRVEHSLILAYANSNQNLIGDSTADELILNEGKNLYSYF